MNNLQGFGLALAATTSLLTANGGPTGNEPLLQGDGKVTFSAGKGITFDAGDGFKLNLTHRIQAKWRYIQNDGAANTNGFRMRRVRQKVKGHFINKNVHYMMQLEHADTTSTEMKDVWLKWVFMPGDAPISVRVGQGKFRGGLQSDASSGGLEFVERSIASRTFADTRSTGALLEGSALDEGMLNWFFGVHNSDQAGRSSAAGEENRNNGQNEVNFVAGVRFDPNGNIGSSESWTEGDLKHSGEAQSTAGASIAIVNENNGTVEVEATTINIFGALKTGSGLSGQAEVFIRSDDVQNGGESDSTGWYLQGGYTMPPEEGKTQWGGALRASMVDFDDAPVGLLGSSAPLDGSTMTLTGAGDVFEINGTVSAYYAGHKLKTQIGYTFQTISPTGGTELDNHGIEVMVTASF